MKNIFTFLLFILLVLPTHAQLTPAVVKPLPTFNAIVNGGFENGKTGWLTYKDAAGALPVDGTAGTATTISFSTSLTNPLFEKSSGLITHAATNGQGEGVSYDFVIQGGDKGKVQAITGTYQILSGTYSGGTSTTDSDIELYIYDKDTATLIQPSGYKLDGGIIGINYLYNATFQPVSITSTNYRLIFHNATATASAFVLKTDSIYVGTQIKTQVPPITGTNTNYIFSGTLTTNATNTYQSNRIGDQLHVSFSSTFTGANTQGQSAINLPIALNTAKLSNPSGRSVLGQWFFRNGGGTLASGAVVANIGGAGTGQVTLEGVISSSNVPSTFGAATELSAEFSYPPLGLESTVQTSDISGDPRPFGVTASRSSSAIGANVPVTNWTVTKDYSGSFNASSGVYTVPAAGDYSANWTSVLPTSGSTGPNIYYNGSSVAAGPSAVAGSTRGTVSATILNAKAGDLITFVGDSAVTLDASTRISIVKNQSPQQIAATEAVGMRYITATGQSLPSGNTTLSFGTPSYDSHNAWSGTTYTVPVSGKYYLKAQIGAAAPSAGLSGNLMRILKNGSTISEEFYTNSYTNTANYSYKISDEINLIAGDTIQFQFSNGFGTTTTVIANSIYNFCNIRRTGN